MKVPTGLFLVLALGVFSTRAALAVPDVSSQRAVQVTVKLFIYGVAAIQTHAQTRVHRFIHLAQKQKNNILATTTTPNRRPATATRQIKVAPVAGGQRQPTQGPIPIPYPNIPNPPQPPKPCVPFTICGPETLPLPQ